MRKRIKSRAVSFEKVDVASIISKHRKKPLDRGGVSWYKPYTGKVDGQLDILRDVVTDTVVACQIRKFLGTFAANGFGKDFFVYNLTDILGTDLNHWPVTNLTKFADGLLAEYNRHVGRKNAKPFKSAKNLIDSICKTVLWEP